MIRLIIITLTLLYASEKGISSENDGNGNNAATGRRTGGAIKQARLDVLGTGKAGHGQGVRVRDTSSGTRLQETRQPSKLSLRQSSASRPAVSVQARVTAYSATEDRLFTAIVQVESGGNPNAVGDKGRSHGLIQCQMPAFRDALWGKRICASVGVSNRPISASHEDYWVAVKDYSACRRIFYAYTTKYGAVTDEQRARCWNSGPAWRSKYSKTNKYWAKVQKAMKG